MRRDQNIPLNPPLTYHDLVYHPSLHYYLNFINGTYFYFIISIAPQRAVSFRGLYTKCLKYTSRKNLVFALQFFLCMGALSVIVSGPIAYGATSFEGKQGLHEWQYIILTEGAPTVIVALLSFCLLFDDITEVGWLTEKQKESHEARIAVHIKIAEREPITMKTMRTVLYDIKTWIFGVIAMLSSINMTSIGVFSLVIIKGGLKI